jgi:hypothetical protein
MPTKILTTILAIVFFAIFAVASGIVPVPLGNATIVANTLVSR